jgi:hypothetical protein
MGFESSKFGNGISSLSAGGNVVVASGAPSNYFGARDTGGVGGVLKVEGLTEQLIINLDGVMFNDGVDAGLVNYIIPAGAIIKAAYIDVEEAFALSGTDTLAVEVGTSGSAATNGFTITEAQIEATASVNLTSALSGTWDAEAPLAADTTVSIVLSGTNPVITDAGKARITIVYDRANL